MFVTWPADRLLAVTNPSNRVAIEDANFKASRKIRYQDRFTKMVKPVNSEEKNYTIDLHYTVYVLFAKINIS